MNGIRVIFLKEWLSFTGSEKGVFAVYGFLVVLWSLLFMSTRVAGSPMVYTIWMLTFAIVVCSNFSQATFVSERVSGSLEILLTCGLSRVAILAGKMGFVVGMSLIMGYLCIGLSVLWSSLLPPGSAAFGPSPADLPVFAAAAFMNVASAAWLSIRLNSPRMLHFVNFALTGAVVGLYFGAGAIVAVPQWALSGLLMLVGTAFTWFAWKAFDSEKIVQPVNL